MLHCKIWNRALKNDLNMMKLVALNSES